MQRLSTAFLIYALAIVVNKVGATGHFYTYEEKTDQLATEAKNRAVTIIDGPKYVAPPSTPPPAPTNHTEPEQRPPSKPPITPTPDKHGKPKYVELPRIYIGHVQNVPHRPPYPKQVKLHSNSVYKIQKVIPLPPNRNTLYPKHQQLVFAASTSKPSIAQKSPKFSLPIETINGIRADFVRPPHLVNTTTTSTTTVPTTTTKYLRTKRIWPKHILEKQKASNTTGNVTNTSNNYTNTDNELSSSASNHRIKIILSDNVNDASTANPSTRPPYRRVTRVPKKKPTTAAPANYSTFEPNDWVPIVPSHYPVKKVRKPQQSPIRSRRSDRSEVYFLNEPNESPDQSKDIMFLESFGLLPVPSSPSSTAAPKAARKNIMYVGKAKHSKPHVYSGYRGKPVVHTMHINGDYQAYESDPMKIVTRIKHHHHHHHHRYIKTVEKPVRVEVPKQVSVPVPYPVPVRVEHKVPYPVQVKVPHPVPVKVIEKQYVPKPYPVVQVQQVPVIQHVQVPVHIEKKVPYPVKVEVPVPKPYPVAVPVEKKVPYPVPVRILVPQPYPVETKVPVPVKEPVEVIKHVPVRVPVPQPYPVRVPVPVPYEKKVPYPVEVEKKVPVPYRVLVPEKVEVEKRVPVYVPKPYPVEKKVPVPFKVPYPVRVPIRVPVGVPILVHPSPNNDERVVSSLLSVAGDGTSNNNNNQQQLSVSTDGTYNNDNNHQQLSVSSDGTYNNNNNQQQLSVSNDGTYNNNNNQQQLTHYAFSVPFAVSHNTVTNVPQNSVTVSTNSGTAHLNNINSIINTITADPHDTVTVHGTPEFQKLQQRFQSRSDVVEEYTTPYSMAQSISTETSTESTLSAFPPKQTDEVTTVSLPEPR